VFLASLFADFGLSTSEKVPTRMRFLICLLVNLLLSEFTQSELMEMKCDEVKVLSYYERYYGTKCTISDISGDSSSTFVIRSANNFEYSKIIQEVEIKTSKLYDMPHEIFGTFQQLKKVQANSCGLEDLHKSNFKYASALVELRMRSNKIKKLASSVFSSMQTLNTLDLNANEIDEVAKTAFAGLESLEYLTLSNNKLVSLDENIFQELTALLSVRLDNNKLQIIEENTFVHNVNLSDIRLDANEIAVINGNPFDKLRNLKNLNLGNNRLHKLDIVNSNIERLFLSYNKLKSLEVNKNLKYLNAQYNELEEINFAGNTEMLELKLRQNSIKSLVNFASLSRLEVFDISFNPIGQLNISSFSRMNNLVRLNLESTNLTKDSLTFGTFAHNSNLSVLDISYNQLQEIDFRIFTALNNLVQLKIDGNNLTRIPHETLKTTFPKLSLISFTDNEWNCTYLASMIKTLRGANVIIFMVSKLRVYDETNVDGIRCYNNKTERVIWRRPVVHYDDNESENSAEKSPNPASPVSILRANLTDIWNKISEIQVSLSRLDEHQKFVSTFQASQALVSNPPSDDIHIRIVQSEFGSIKIILCLIFFIMLVFASTAIVKSVKSLTKKQFYYPSDGFRRSTATIQTTMENVM
jgi:Leucine-rich repeat (LRR) protein